MLLKIQRASRRKLLSEYRIPEEVQVFFLNDKRTEKKKIKMVTAEPWGGGPTHSCQIYLNESCFHANRSDGKRQIQYA